ncbi:MAG: hypothetical protein HWD82_03525 [Flavobacteriaceae bacterium]|nr:hypothetical protein [Flavobacteriaceae bacterium]
MKFSFSKKQLNISLFLGLVWLANAVFQTFFNENPKWYDYSWFIFAIIYLGIYFYRKHYNYITIDNTFIRKNWWFGKKLLKKDIIKIKHYGGEFILKTTNKELKINLALIDTSTRIEIKKELEKLNAECI